MSTENLERKGFDHALDLIIEWGLAWEAMHDEPFDYLRACQSLKVSKVMQLPYSKLALGTDGTNIIRTDEEL